MRESLDGACLTSELMLPEWSLSKLRNAVRISANWVERRCLTILCTIRSCSSLIEPAAAAARDAAPRLAASSAASFAASSAAFSSAILFASLAA